MSDSNVVLADASRQETGDDFVDSFQLSARWLESSVEHTRRVTDRQRGIRNAVRIERWERKREIGRGGFGTVYLEEDQHGQLRAVKEVKKIAPPKVQTINFLREILAMAHFTQEEALFVKFEGWYQSEDLIHIAMEYFPNGDLSNCVKEPLPESEVRVITCQIAEGLEFMHAKRFAHRDIKPSNIFVVSTSPTWWIKLGDFGVSKRVKDDSTSMHTSIATEFTAPEMAGFVPMKDEAECYTSKVDIWSLGCLCHWLLTQKLPLARLQMLPFCMGRTKLPLQNLADSDVTPEGIDFLERLLQAQPDDRLTASGVLSHPWPKEVLVAENEDTDQADSISENENASSYELKDIPKPLMQGSHPICLDQIGLDARLALNDSSSDQASDPVSLPETQLAMLATKLNFLLDVGFSRDCANKSLANGNDDLQAIIQQLPRAKHKALRAGPTALKPTKSGGTPRGVPGHAISATKKHVLEHMGFSSESAVAALAVHFNDLQKSINHLSRNAKQPGSAILSAWPLADMAMSTHPDQFFAIAIQVTIIAPHHLYIGPGERTLKTSIALRVDGFFVSTLHVNEAESTQRDPTVGDPLNHTTCIISCPLLGSIDTVVYQHDENDTPFILLGFATFQVAHIMDKSYITGKSRSVDINRSFLRILENTPEHGRKWCITLNFKTGFAIDLGV